MRDGTNQFIGIEISGFDIKAQDDISSKDPSPDKKITSNSSLEIDKTVHVTPGGLKNLDIIEETAEDRSNHSHYPNNSAVLRHSTENLSSGKKDKIAQF
jgi:hypothetical protein